MAADKAGPAFDWITGWNAAIIRAAEAACAARDALPAGDVRDHVHNVAQRVIALTRSK